MDQTKKSLTSRGRPKKDFHITQKSIEKNTISEINTVTMRGRPKKIRKIDDSINTQIDNQKKSITRIQKENEKISNQIGVSTFSTKKITNQKKENNETSSKNADNFALILLICSMCLFIFALFKTFFIDKNIQELNIQDLSLINNPIQDINNDIQYNIPQEINNESEIIDENSSTYLGNNIDIIEEESPDIQLITEFYKHINNLDFSNINLSVDKYLKNSDVFKTYFTQNRLTNFSKKIDNGGVSIHNITQLSGNENTTRYYSYQITYHINQELYQEERETAIVNRNGKELIGSLKCVTTGCSKMPFFQK